MNGINRTTISVGVIACNNGSTLSQSLDSLLSQTHPPTEIIISDDCSSDNTEKVAREYARRFRHIQYFRQRKNLGIAANSQFVLEKAKGTYFMWATDEDLWHEDFIQELCTLLEANPQAGLAMSQLALCDNRMCQRSLLPFPQYSSGYSLFALLLQQPALLVWGIFRTKTLLRSGGFHRNRYQFFGGSDFITVLRVLIHSGLAFSQKTFISNATREMHYHALTVYPPANFPLSFGVK